MRCLSLQRIIISLSCLACFFAVSGCTAKNSPPHPQNSSPATVDTRKCAEWEQAQASNQGLGWDLVYESTLNRNGFGPDNPMWKWIHMDGPRPPVSKLVAEWQGEPIISSILIEVVGPEGSPGGFWFIRTTNHLYHWSFNKGKFDSQKEELAALREFDEAFEKIACWQQAAPTKTDTMFEGYYGFLSLYKEGRSRQILLTFRDFFLVDPRNNEADLENPNTWGRIWKTLQPVLSKSKR
jgi:hypothetical protein